MTCFTYYVQCNLYGSYILHNVRMELLLKNVTQRTIGNVTFSKINRRSDILLYMQWDQDYQITLQWHFFPIPSKGECESNCSVFCCFLKKFNRFLPLVQLLGPFFTSTLFIYQISRHLLFFKRFVIFSTSICDIFTREVQEMVVFQCAEKLWKQIFFFLLQKKINCNADRVSVSLYYFVCI